MRRVQLSMETDERRDLIRQLERIVHHVVALGLLDHVLAKPALTALLPFHFRGAFGNGFGQFLGQFMIATYTISIRTSETKHGLGETDIHIIGQLPLWDCGSWPIVPNTDRQRLQLAICRSQSW